MEDKVFPLPAVADELNAHFIEARLHTDFEANMKLEDKLLKSFAVPSFAIVDPASGATLATNVGWIPSEQGFLEFLQKARSTGE